MQEQAGAFVPGERFELSARRDGSLAGLTFAVKDLFAVAGRKTGAGNPTWKETHAAAARNALAVDRLLAAGAVAVGKTITDELAYSIVGRNFHFGTPKNGAAPERMPGGSSSGSASAVSNGLCDFALGTDSGGSVRVPAAYCGLFGMRPSHGRIPLEGCLPLCPSYDTCGWFARSAQLLERVGHVLLGSHRLAHRPVQIVLAAEVWGAAEADVRAALLAAVKKMGSAEERPLFAEPSEWTAIAHSSMTLQGFEAWQTFGEWIRTANPVFGPEIAERFRLASAITVEDAQRAARQRESFMSKMAQLLPEGTLLCFPTTPTVAPLRSGDPDRLQAVRLKTLQFTCMAGMARLPQITIPVLTASGAPCALSFIARHGADETLLNFVSEAI